MISIRRRHYNLPTLMNFIFRSIDYSIDDFPHFISKLSNTFRYLYYYPFSTFLVSLLRAGEVITTKNIPLYLGHLRVLRAKAVRLGPINDSITTFYLMVKHNEEKSNCDYHVPTARTDILHSGVWRQRPSSIRFDMKGAFRDGCPLFSSVPCVALPLLFFAICYTCLWGVTAQ